MGPTAGRKGESYLGTPYNRGTHLVALYLNPDLDTDRDDLNCDPIPHRIGAI